MSLDQHVACMVSALQADRPQLSEAIAAAVPDAVGAAQLVVARGGGPNDIATVAALAALGALEDELGVQLR